jgi:GWxTD domain-containing protein
LQGSAVIALTTAPKILVAKIIDINQKRAWLYYKTLEPNYPVNNYALIDNRAMTKPYKSLNQNFVLAGNERWVLSYYEDIFPPASPAFAETQARVSKTMKSDSSLIVNGGQEINFPEKGLFLIQKDTNSTEGFSFRSEDDYPRLSKVQSLAEPFIYLCTKQEYDKLVAAKGDKKAFDRTVLNITNDTDRARDLMRTYFKRVEMANQFFTSYKEGWKTDRGMIYIIFGLPSQVLKFNDREVWSYNNDAYKVTFNFSKASSVFDPDNYVLIRDKKYQETWYEVIDLWRSARFQ